MTTRRWLIAGVAGVAALLLLGRAATTLYIDYRWYDLMGAASLWRARAAYELLLRLLLGTAGTLFAYLNLNGVRRTVASLVVPRRVANLEIGEEVPSRALRGGVFIVSLALGAILTFTAGDWRLLAAAHDGLPFQETDPFFAIDISFFVHWLPFERALFDWAVIAWLMTTLLVITLYAVTRSLRWEQRRLRTTTHARRHLAVLAALLLLLMAWSYRLDAYGVLLNGSGADGAFTYVDHKIVASANLFLALVSLAVAVAVAWAGWMGQLRTAVWSLTALVALSVALRVIVPRLSTQWVSPAAAQKREDPYLKTRALYTRRAFDLDRIRQSDSAIALTTPRALARALSAWDARAARRMVARSRRGGPIDPAIAWRARGDGIEATVFERPGDGESALAGWNAVRVPGGDDLMDIDARAPEGTPAVMPLPPVLVEDSARGVLLVADSTGEPVGVPVDGWGARLALAWSQQNFRLLFGDLPQPRPRVVLRRDVSERVEALAPFFLQGRTLGAALDGDTLYWVVHLFAASADYPLAWHLPLGDDELSYFQHAATAFVQASTGRVLIVADSAPGPIARTWFDRFPEVYRPWDAIAPALAADVPPDVDGARVLAGLFARFGSRSLGLASRAPTYATGADSLLGAAPAPVLVGPVAAGVPGRLAWTVPMLDATDHVAGLMIATGGVDHAVLWHPLAPPGPAWRPLLDRLQAAGGAPEATAPVPPRDPATRRGALRCVPWRASMACAQTDYDWPRDPIGVPSIARVTITVGDSVRSGQDIAEALHLPAGDSAASPPLGSEAFRARVNALYDAMREAMRRGDWVAFGRAWEALGAALHRPERSLAPPQRHR